MGVDSDVRYRNSQKEAEDENKTNLRHGTLRNSTYQGEADDTGPEIASRDYSRRKLTRERERPSKMIHQQRSQGKGKGVR